ncbi:hypothetical protein VM1G_04545 [Cytospora mali]|uniref:Glycoside hydrolase family 92 protein n=1 Tax=Cytospora mali TaxID=578113 RepID=A0A194VVS2_CYTMA|nr:hypothetical protein VM1G_04545 [Valsa mali]
MERDLTLYASPMVGAIDGGNTFPGVSWPFGMVKLGPDLDNGKLDAYSGYLSGGKLTGFSMLHESGTGGAPKYGVVSQMPTVGEVKSPLKTLKDARQKPDVAEVGYYKAFLKSGVTVELAGTERAGMYRYTFPSKAKRSSITVDASHVLTSYRGMGLEQHYYGGSIEVTDKGKQYMGHGIYNNGWNRAPPWTVYFCGYFDTHEPPQYKTFVGHSHHSNELKRYPAGDKVESKSRLGAVFSFNDDETVITSRVGVSFISTEQACANVNSQIPSGTHLEELTQATRDAWNSKVFSKITTNDTRSKENLELLYSSLYHMHLLPTNKTGENPLWKSDEPYYDDIFTFWDLFRCTTPLLHILQPTHYTGLIRSLIDIWRYAGFMPDGRSSLSNGATQGGSNADNVLADAYVKGVRDGIDWSDGLAAMLTDAEVVPPNPKDPRDRTSSIKEGRGALPDWKKYGYITLRYHRSVSCAVEYSANDFAVWQVAAGEGLANASTYLGRSRNWRNHWNPRVKSLGFKGFLVARSKDGGHEITGQDARSCDGCYWGDIYYQGTPWAYSFNAHHDMARLVELSGGPARFTERLEAFFQPGNRLFDATNEPSFTTPYLFSFVGRQDLTVATVRNIAKEHYRPTPDGLPGNSDAGAMESWVLWAMIGLYPLTGQTTFLVGSPWFSDLRIDLGGGKALEIRTEGGSDEAYYVQGLKVNGRVWDKAWVSWEDIFVEGGTLDFVLGSKPVRWATGPLPPSPASV